MKGKTGAPKTKKMMAGGMTKKGYAAGGAMPMKDGKPAFIGDGKGKMAAGGMAKAKMMASGGMTKTKMMASGGATSLKQHASMPASKAHKGLKTGGRA